MKKSDQILLFENCKDQYVPKIGLGTMSKVQRKSQMCFLYSSNVYFIFSRTPLFFHFVSLSNGLYLLPLKWLKLLRFQRGEVCLLDPPQEQPFAQSGNVVFKGKIPGVKYTLFIIFWMKLPIQQYITDKNQIALRLA